MSATTKINWTDATWNPVSGCTPAGVGCAHCYAKRVAERFPAVHGGKWWSEAEDSEPVPFSRVICHPERLGIPFRWKKPRAIMCPSMGDLFHPAMSSDFRWEVFKVMERCPQHTFIVLTKRVKEMAVEMAGFGLSPLPNVVLGASFSTQKEVDDGMVFLLNTPAHRHIVSLEPLVGPVSLNGYLLSCRDCGARGMRMCGDCKGSDREAVLDGVIVGGESGPGARPMHPDWVRSLRDQCEAAGVPFFFKQWGEWAHGQWDGVKFSATVFDGFQGRKEHMFRCGRHRAGRLLDGRTHDALCWDVRGKGEA